MYFIFDVFLVWKHMKEDQNPALATLLQHVNKNRQNSNMYNIFKIYSN